MHLIVILYRSNVVCFLVPFDEDDKDKTVWFLDHDYLENMYGMFKKVNGKMVRIVILPTNYEVMFTVFYLLQAREKIVGWYHTGPKLHQNDVAINDLIRRYCTNSVRAL